MSDTQRYDVNLHVGLDSRPAEQRRNDRVLSLVSRQMLCCMTANIEYNISLLNEAGSEKDRDMRSGDGLRCRNLNYLISGVRGSGKTTFLNYLIKSLTHEIDPFSKDAKYPRYSADHYIGCKRKSVKCQLLYRYDPSSPAASGNSFLISVVAAIQSLLDKYHKEPGFVYAEHNLSELDCNHVLKQLDKGISRLSRTKFPLENLSEYEAVNLRSENAVLEEQIRNNFHRALDLMCRVCGVDAFIVAIDDADTRFSQCANVIEDLRLYMTHPRLVVLLAGDRDLYLERIRELHFKEYDKEYHHADFKGKEYRMEFVMNHASQYIIKQFPLENQYQLRDVAYLSSKLDPIYCRLVSVVEANGETKELSEDLISFVRKVFRTVINSESSDLEHYVHLFLSIPLRTLLQVIDAWVSEGVWSCLLRLEKLKSDIDAAVSARATAKEEHKDAAQESLKILLRKREADKNVLRNVVKNTLFAAWESEIRVSDYQFDKLDLDDPRGFFPLMLQLCIRMNDVDHGFFLAGDSGENQSDRRVLMLLALTSGCHMRNFENCLSYLLFGPATVALFAKAVEQARWEKTDRTPEAKEKLSKLFFRYFQVNNRISPTRWGRHADMVWGFDPGREGLHTGVLRLRYTQMVGAMKEILVPSSPGNPAGADTRQADAVGIPAAAGERKRMKWEELPSPVQLKGRLALAVSMGHSEARDNSYFLSLFGFLGFILRCLQCCRRSEEEYEEQRKQAAASQAPSAETEAEKKAREKGEKDEKMVARLCRVLYNAVPIKSCRNPEWLISGQRHEGFNETSILMEPGNNIFEGSQGAEKPSSELEAIAREIYQWYQLCKSAEEDVIDDDVSPRRMGDLWANMYYRLKGICYSRTGARMMTDITENGVAALGSQIESMTAAYLDFFSLNESELTNFSEALPDKLPENVRSRTHCYRWLIGRFPLTVPFCHACNAFADKLASLQKDEQETKATPPASAEEKAGHSFNALIAALKEVFTQSSK